MSTLAKWTIRPRLMAIPGVANVAIWGQRDRQLQVLVDPDRLQAHGVTVDDVVRAAGEAVSLQAGGFLDTPNQRLAITHAAVGADAPAISKRIVVASRNGAALRIGDVATVVEGFPQPIGDAVINNGPGLLLIVEKQLGANTLQVTRDVEAALEDLKPALAGVARRSGDLPPGDVHRDVAAESVARAADRLRARHPRAARVPRRLADGAHQQHRDPAVAARGRAAAALPRRHARHDGARRPGHRARRGRGRRDHRRREHRPAAAAESAAAESAAGDPRSCSTRRWKCAARCSTAA